MRLVLSVLSSRGLCLVTDDNAEKIISTKYVNETDGAALSEQLAHMIEMALQKFQLEWQDFSALYCMAGPGGFTGLRMAGALMLGLAKSCQRPLYPIDSYDLFGRDFFIPLRHQQARLLTLTECFERGIEFLKITSEGSFLCTPKENDLVLGLKNRPHWPDPPELMIALKKNLNTNRKFELNYGLTPKIFGKRDPVL